MFLTRALISVFLIPFHIFIFLITYNGIVRESFINTDLFYFIDKIYFLGLFLLLLPLIFGFNSGAKNVMSFFDTFSTVLFLLFFGFIMNSLIWGFGSNSNFNILQFFAVCLFFVFIARKFLNFKYFGLLGAFFLAVYYLFFNFVSNLNNSFLNFLFGISESFSVIWPIFPWVGVFLIGFHLGEIYEKYDRKYDFLYIVFALLFMSPLSFFASLRPQISHSYPLFDVLVRPNLSLLIFVLGIFLFLIFLSKRYLNNLNFNKYGIVDIFSRGILFVYVSQMFFGILFVMVIDKIFHLTPGIYYDLKDFFIYFIIINFIVFLICRKISLWLLKIFDKRLIIEFKKN